MSDATLAEPRWRGHFHPGGPQSWRGPGAALRRALAEPGDLTAHKRDLLALMQREKHHTMRLAIVALTIVAAIGCLIPIATARPRWRPPPDA